MAFANQRLEALAASPQWLALLHVNEGGTLRGRGHSYITEKDFFLADKGRQNPLAELVASVDQLQSGGQLRCRFPARYKFLAKHLGWHQSAPFAACDEYLAWRNKVPDQRVVLAFPAAYLNSPSSMFGHVFLRLDGSRNPQSVLTSWAVTYAANTSGDDGSFSYAFKGIFGGYPGYFSVAPYAEKLDEYSSLENRDIWEYALSLTPEEVGRMVDHLWELKGVSLGYYFFDENCAYGLLGLIQVARPTLALTRQLRLAQSPLGAVRELAEKGLVNSRHYRPSKEVQLRWQVAHLPAKQQVLAKRIAADPALAKQSEFTRLDSATRQQVANLAYSYLRYQHSSGERDPKVAKNSFALLRLVHANAGEKPVLPPAPVPVAPDLGHDRKLVALRGGQRADVGFTDLEWRFAYHDWLDNNAGFLQGAEIKGFDVVLRRYINHADKRAGDKLQLQSLQLVDVRSLAPRDRFVKPISWFVDGGLEQVQTGRERLVRYLQGGAGLSWRFGDAIPYIYAKARVENNSAYKPLIETGAGSEIGMLYYRGRFSAQLGLDGVYFANDDWRSRANVGLNWALDQQNALRLTAQHERYRNLRVNQWGLAWRHYY